MNASYDHTVTAKATGTLTLRGAYGPGGERGAITIAQAVSFLQEALQRGAEPSTRLQLTGPSGQQIAVAIPAELTVTYPPPAPAASSSDSAASASDDPGAVTFPETEEAALATVTDIMAEFATTSSTASATAGRPGRPPWRTRNIVR